MKYFLFITLIFLTINISAQNQTPAKDNTIPVSYGKGTSNPLNAVMSVNGEFVRESLWKSFDPDLVEDVKIVKQAVEFENIKYTNVIQVKLKDNKLKQISLNELKAKYTNLRNESAIFILENELINADYDTFLVDENFILKIAIEKIDNKKEGLQFNYIRLITKTAANVEESKKFYIR